jgi:hypothetical protein
LLVDLVVGLAFFVVGDDLGEGGLFLVLLGHCIRWFL